MIGVAIAKTVAKVRNAAEDASEEARAGVAGSELSCS